MIFLTSQALGTVTSASALAVTAKTAGVSFVITASQATDTSTIAWFIVN
jgi:phosphate-selective porin